MAETVFQGKTPSVPPMTQSGTPKTFTHGRCSYLVDMEDETANPLPVDRWTCQSVAGDFKNMACVTLGFYGSSNARIQVFVHSREPEQALFRLAASRRKAVHSRESLIDSVAHQVSSSQRLEGIEVSPSEVKRMLSGRKSS